MGFFGFVGGGGGFFEYVIVEEYMVYVIFDFIFYE